MGCRVRDRDRGSFVGRVIWVVAGVDTRGPRATAPQNDVDVLDTPSYRGVPAKGLGVCARITRWAVWECEGRREEGEKLCGPW